MKNNAAAGSIKLPDAGHLAKILRNGMLASCCVPASHQSVSINTNVLLTSLGLFHWIVTRAGTVSLQMLQTLIARGRTELLPANLSGVAVRPRDRQAHVYLERVLEVADMEPARTEALQNAMIVCTRHPSPFPMTDADSDTNLLKDSVPLDLVITPDSTSACLIDVDGERKVININKCTSKNAFALPLTDVPPGANRITIADRRLVLSTGKRIVATEPISDWVAAKDNFALREVTVTCGMNSLEPHLVAAETSLSATLFVVADRKLYKGELEGDELQVSLVNEIPFDVLDLAVGPNGPALLLRGGTLAGDGLPEYTNADAKRLAVCANGIVNIVRGAYIDRLTPDGNLVTLLKPANVGDRLTDDLAQHATSSTVLAITSRGNCVEFLDRCGALRFLTNGDALLQYLRYEEV